MIQTQTVSRKYAPSVFDQDDIENAKGIILTYDDTQSTEERWRRETPYLLELMKGLALTEKSVVLDYGCGIGRLSLGLMERYGCTVVGVDISANMRAFAAHYVGNRKFMVCHPHVLNDVDIKFDAAISVWVLQHCIKPAGDIDAIYRGLKPGGSLFVVDAVKRLVPVEGGLWLDDGNNVGPLLEQTFNTPVKRQPLDAAHVAPCAASSAYWAILKK
jgi:ubiquinone/menaquinone biosynthesis C-methylase UbiE